MSNEPRFFPLEKIPWREKKRERQPLALRFQSLARLKRERKGKGELDSKKVARES